MEQPESRSRGAARLPGYREEAVVRHFEAPDAVPTRFYEVRAKSILNRVPAASQMPFRWTINPYRGCTHACIYCQSGDTRVLHGRRAGARAARLRSATRSTEPPARDVPQVRRDEVWTSGRASSRRTGCELEDGTELLASDEHRFLTRRGWKHVIGSENGRASTAASDRRLSAAGSGRLGRPPGTTHDYRRGYLCGMIRGDGTSRSSQYHRPGRSARRRLPVSSGARRRRGARAQLRAS